MIAYGFAILILCVSNMILGARVTILEKKMKQVRETSKWDRS